MSFMNKLINIIKWSRVTNPGADNEDQPISQIEYMDRAATSVMIWPYGMGAVAPADALCITMSVGADEVNRASIATVPKSRVKGLKPGETFFGNPITGSLFIFLQDGKLNATIKGDMDLTIDGKLTVTSKEDIEMTAPNVIINGNIEVSGSLNALGGVNLGGVGGKAIAGVGDTVSGGVITSGSSNSFTN